MVKSDAKNTAKKGQALSLAEVLDLAYVKEFMEDAEVANIKNNYEKAPKESKENFCDKLVRINEYYVQFSSEKDPEKRKALMMEAVKNGFVDFAQKAKDVKKIALKKVESVEHDKEVMEIEEKLAKI